MLTIASLTYYQMRFVRQQFRKLLVTRHRLHNIVHVTLHVGLNGEAHPEIVMRGSD
jgi:hypothetical protein